MSSPARPMNEVFGGPVTVSSKFLWKRYVGGAAGLIVGIGASVGYLVLEVGEIQDLQRDTAVWEDPSAGHATEVSAEGEVKSQLLLSEYKLKVQYTDEAGVQHTSKVEFSTLPELDHVGSPMVHYDRADPTRFALSYAVKERNKRLAAIVGLLLVGTLLVGGSFAFLGGAALRNARAFRRIADNGQVVLCELVKITEMRQYGRHVSTTYRYRVPAGPRPQPFERQQAFTPKSGGPLTVKDRVVGVWTPDKPKLVMLLGVDFSPLVLAPAQQAQAKQRLEAD
jgi:hypothetical protein